ncbi:MAG: 23S rRNA (uracil(1939)-C(5))-methyltransferase RlmD [Ruminococcaceae bacterium]|nr:23S rRNA (uracil(1939)-C(5))-methyltransferase RlmD [Oscillospiraceae bacterium]
MSHTSNIKTNPDACPLAKKCGGCQLQNMSYERQLRWKQARCEILLKKFGKVEKIIGMENPYHYRNKVQAAFGRTKSGKIISGVYQSGSHRIVMVDSCMTEDKIADEIIVDIRNMLPKFKIWTYDEDRGTGFLRHVLVKRGFSSGEVMVVIVGASGYFPMKKKFTAALLEKHPEITTVVLNINPKDTNLVLGDREEVLYGNGYIEDTLCGCVFRISPKSFYQINPVQTEKLYGKAMELAELDENTKVLDAYCGIGTIGLVAAQTAGSVIGVELNPDAVKDAISNAKRNDAKNARFYCADAGDFMQELAENGERFDVIFMDPPRSGSSKKFIDSLAVAAPERVVYISCNPETLARDLQMITKKGYKVRRICPVDMFPHTNHIETVCLLSKLNTKHHIEIDLDMDELDLTDAEKKATYQEIKDYVLEHSGLKVSSLNIAQIKQKCGFIERDCYNKPKSEDARQPQCPPNKEKAIKEALKHFGMIK